MFRMYDTDKNGYLDQVFCFLHAPPDDHDDHDDHDHQMTMMIISIYNDNAEFVCVSDHFLLSAEKYVCVCLFVTFYTQFPQHLYVCLSVCHEK